MDEEEGYAFTPKALRLWKSLGEDPEKPPNLEQLLGLMDYLWPGETQFTPDHLKEVFQRLIKLEKEGYLTR